MIVIRFINRLRLEKAFIYQFTKVTTSYSLQLNVFTDATRCNFVIFSKFGVVNLENTIIRVTFANTNSLILSIMCNDIVVRLKQFMSHVGLPSTQFADCAKIARPTISQLLNGRNRKVSNELISKLHDAFPELNILWLMFGDGNMINKTVVNNASAQSLFQRSSADVGDNNRGSQISDPQMGTVNIRRDNIVSSNRETIDNYNTQDQYSTPHDKASASTPAMQIPITPNTDTTKRIKSIMVFYTDSSFEIFTPSNM